ncbi:MAG: M67 family metallopeptidase [Caldilineaceae bacterium]
MNQLEAQSVKLPRPIHDEIIAHAREGKPEEICGVLRGRGMEALELIRGRNVASERIDNYEVDPQTLLLQFKFEEAGDAMMGIYHSHPISVAYPSATDAWNAHYPDAVYFICSLEFDNAPVIRAFGMNTHFMDGVTSAQAAAIRNSARFFEIRPNSSVYAHYVERSATLANAILQLAEPVQPPLYVEYFADDTEIFDLRIIEITEYPIEVTA